MLKTLPVIIFLAITACQAHAQISKGSLFLGGRVQYSGEKTDPEGLNVESKSNYFNVAPAIGLAIRENLILGVELSFLSTVQKNGNNTFRDEKSYGGGLFLRRYVNLGKNFYFFGQGNTGINFFDNQYSFNPLEYNDGYRVSLAVYPGISYAINKKFQIETGLNNLFFADYTRTKGFRNNMIERTTNSFNIGTSLSNPISLNVGVRIILGK